MEHSGVRIYVIINTIAEKNRRKRTILDYSLKSRHAAGKRMWNMKTSFRHKDGECVVGKRPDDAEVNEA